MVVPTQAWIQSLSSGKGSVDPSLESIDGGAASCTGRAPRLRNPEGSTAPHLHNTLASRVRMPTFPTQQLPGGACTCCTYLTRVGLF